MRTTVTAEQFEPVTDWMPATGLTDVKMVIKRKSVQLTGTAPTFNVKPAIDVSKVNAAFVIAGISGNFQCQLAVRAAATSIQSPSSWSKLEGASYRTANGETTTGELTVTAGSDMFVQFGVAFCQSTAGAAPGQATVSTAVAVRWA
ncbi:MAG: hypothetical protein FJ102_15440 [Deltaproteobacteria bacterium]|nr:hypothetical protein [Deltaproteobacteria bacterium]